MQKIPIFIQDWPSLLHLKFDVHTQSHSQVALQDALLRIHYAMTT